MPLLDSDIRLRTFEWLAEQTAVRGEVLPRALLAQGMVLMDERIPLLGPQGIFKPRGAAYPLSITTVPNSPYDDSFSGTDLLAYRYRGDNPYHHENAGLRRALEDKVPLVYFFGLVPGKYLAMWPVYIVGDDPAALTFTVAVDDLAASITPSDQIAEEGAAARRAYITTLARRRLHQRSFRAIVLKAYREQCSLCRLRHEELLDAAHIIEDTHADGVPTVQNGISLCKLHHAAFDAMMVGITPDYRIHVRQDLLDENDGPMLQHGLQGINSSKLILPHRRELWPSQEALEFRYERFLKAS